MKTMWVECIFSKNVTFFIRAIEITIMFWVCNNFTHVQIRIFLFLYNFGLFLKKVFFEIDLIYIHGTYWRRGGGGGGLI